MIERLLGLLVLIVGMALGWVLLIRMTLEIFGN